MATLVLRIPKGSELTHAELDGNLTALNNDIATRATTASVASSIGAAVGTASSTVTANTRTANYTLTLADAGTVVEMNVATANTVTVPANATAAFAVGSVVEVWQMGAGKTTVAAAGGVTIRAPGATLGARAQYSSLFLRKRAADEWVLGGDAG
jgi:hypothetical protein